MSGRTSTRAGAGTICRPSRYIYFWADGIHVQARLEDDAQCLLVIIGATPEGKKEPIGLIAGVRESAQLWRELLIDANNMVGKDDSDDLSGWILWKFIYRYHSGLVRT